MKTQIEIQTDAETTDSLLAADLDLKDIDSSPDQFVSLQYKEYKDSEYVRISAQNEHPDKTIHASFYTLIDSQSDHGFGESLGFTIKSCLKPSETAILHLEEKKQNPRLFLFNAYFDDIVPESQG